jgi:hypothetical protein
LFYKLNAIQRGITEHPIRDEVAFGGDLIAHIFTTYRGDEGMPYFSSTVRYEGDAHYSPKSNHAIQNHAAGDLNWKSAKVEKEIILILGYDIARKGAIYNALIKVGIKQFGTYYEHQNGTFIHIATQDEIEHYEKLPKSVLKKAAEAHQAFAIWAENNPVMMQTIGKKVRFSDYTSTDIEGFSSEFMPSFSDSEEDPLTKGQKLLKAFYMVGATLVIGFMSWGIWKWLKI